MNADEQQIMGFLRKKDLQAREFTKKERGLSKTPDFRVYKGDKFVFFCEVKTIACDDLINNLVAKAPPGKIVGYIQDDPRFNRISNKIHEAVQQFNSVNPNSQFPNVLALVNHDNACGWLDLIGVTTGQFLAEGGSQHPIYTKYSKGRIKEEKFKIDLYIWVDEFKREYFLFNLFEDKHLNNLCNYFGTDPKAIKNILELHQQ